MEGREVGKDQRNEEVRMTETGTKGKGKVGREAKKEGTRREEGRKEGKKEEKD